MKIGNGKINFVFILMLFGLFFGFSGIILGILAEESSDRLIFEGEAHFKNIKQLTFGGDNGEAYFSSDGSMLIFQSKRDRRENFAIYTMRADGTDVKMVSSGKGKTTCSFISPDGKSIIYSSNHEGKYEVIIDPNAHHGSAWPLEDHDVFQADIGGSNLRRLTDSSGYDAEGVYSPLGDKIIFTSARTGDLELWLMDPDGSRQEQLTSDSGYDGGAFFSIDGQWICWRASRPEGKAYDDYRNSLAKNLLKAGKLEIYAMNLSDRLPIKLTESQDGVVNFAPYFHPDGKKIIFSSNLHDPSGHNFELHTVDIETKKIERITYNMSFDGLPMFSYDGKKLVFASNRGGKQRGETNIFIVDWID